MNDEDLLRCKRQAMELGHIHKADSLSPLEVRLKTTIDSLRRSLRQREHDHAAALRALDAVRQEREQLRHKLKATEKALEIRRKHIFPSFRIWRLVIGWSKGVEK